MSADGSFMPLRAVQPLKVPSGRFFMLSESVTSVSDVHLLNVYVPIDSTVFGSTAFLREAQSLNTSSSSFVTPSGIFTSVIALQPPNAFLLTAVSEDFSANVTFSSTAHSANALSGITPREAGTLTDLRFVQLQNTL